MIRTWVLTGVFVSLYSAGICQVDTLELLFRNSYGVFELQRNQLGIYRDSKLFDPNSPDFHPASVANIGMGLISLCIADAMDWDPNARQKAISTLSKMAGLDPVFQPDRNLSGFFRHFLDMETGKNAWDSEYSTIDTGILLAGALFSKTYFSEDEEIAALTQTIWEEVDWQAIIFDETQGQIFLTTDSLGIGIPGEITSPFNEYMLAAWFAMEAEEDSQGPAHTLWNNFYAIPQNLPTNDYAGIPVLADQANAYLSSFVALFPYYLCHPFTSDSSYVTHLSNNRRADSAWWSSQGYSPEYWGLGAGSVNHGYGYHPDAINNNPGDFFSPHIIAGFLPVHPEGKEDLKTLIRKGTATYVLPDGKEILWRKSLADLSWMAPEIQGVDHATMLFGLAALPEFLGPDFFPTYNNYDFPPYETTQIASPTPERGFVVFPNPVSQTLFLQSQRFIPTQVEVKGYDQLGRIQFSYTGQVSEFAPIEIDVAAYPDGLYFLQIKGNGMEHQVKVVKRSGS